MRRNNLTTLCYIEKDNRYLMMHRVKKENDINKDKWVGVGGHIEDGETPGDCLVRETLEECGLKLLSYKPRGFITFISDIYGTEYMHLYTADKFEGEIGACDEGELEWVLKEDVYDLPLWAGDKIFFRLLDERDEYFFLKLVYEGDELVEAVLDENQEFVLHPFGPLYDEEAQTLILGSFPSVKSREENFFYGHKQNRFWKVIANICDAEVPQCVNDKRKLILDNHIALWDVIGSCIITGSSDASIKYAQANDIREIINSSKIGRIFVNGSKAYELYQKFIYPKTNIKAIKLPSTSPANAACSLEKLIEEWAVVKGK